jgi:hypothetical protein
VRSGAGRAFDASTEKNEGGWRTYELAVDVGGEVLLATYRYQGTRLDGFGLVRLPSTWVAYQRAGSKTLRFLLGDPHRCAFSLCTRGPTSDGSCAGEPKP